MVVWYTLPNGATFSMNGCAGPLSRLLHVREEERPREHEHVVAAEVGVRLLAGDQQQVAVGKAARTRRSRPSVRSAGPCPVSVGCESE